MKKRAAALVLAVWLLLCCLPEAALAAPAGGAGVPRYTVLVLDISNTATFLQSGKEIYTAGTAIEYVKNAASRFLTNIGGARSTNYVAVVAYQDTAFVVSDFSNDYAGLKVQVSNLSASSTARSIASGLSAVDGQTMEGMPDAGKDIAEFFQLTAADLASGSEFFYPVDDTNNPEFN